ncbi:hypothetical protein BG000_011469, partial [Podila horticola]
MGHEGNLVMVELFGRTVQESHVVQRRVYEYLALQEDLEELTLSDRGYISRVTGMPIQDEQGQAPFSDPFFQLWCLEMSLESGRESLASLPKLRVLDVTRTAH